MAEANESILLREMGAILIVAVVLGLAYNSLSPLGARSAPATGVYSNETVEVSRQSPAADSGLRNETIGMDIVSTRAAEGVHFAVAGVPATVHWAEVKPRLARGEIVLVDAREPAAFEAGHIPGAVSLPFPEVASRIGVFSAAYPRTRELVIYCASTECPVSRALAIQLHQTYGYVNVSEMPGGYAEWRLAEAAGQGGKQ